MLLGESLGQLDHLCPGDVSVLVLVVELECHLSFVLRGRSLGSLPRIIVYYYSKPIEIIFSPFLSRRLGAGRILCLLDHVDCLGAGQELLDV